jgi:hypothetical protein
MGERRGAYRFPVGKPERKRNFEDPDVEGRILLKGFFRKWDAGIYLIDLAQDRDRWEALVSAVMNLRFP